MVIKGSSIGLQEGEWNISMLCTDSRYIKEGAAFIALKGEKVDGHDYLEQAKNKGAKLAFVEEKKDVNLEQIVVPDTHAILPSLCQQVYKFDKMNLIGVVGTDGKTSITHIINQIYFLSSIPIATIGTLGVYKNNVKEKDLSHTTPPLIELCDILSELKSTVDHVCLEVSSHAIDQRRIGNLKFKIGIFTNLSPEHLDYHLTMDAYAHAKKQFFTQLEAESIAIVNQNDPASYFMIQGSKAKVVYYGMEEESDTKTNQLKATLDQWHDTIKTSKQDLTSDQLPNSENTFFAKNISFKSGITIFDLQTPTGVYSVRLPLVGRYNISNAIAALIAFVYDTGISIEKGIAYLSELGSIPGRLECINPEDSYTVVVDYAHTPAALEKTLKTLRSLTKNKLWTLCNACGDRDRLKRPYIAEIASREADHCIMTLEEVLTESPVQILDELKKGIDPARSYLECPSRYKAIEYAIDHMEAGDVLLLPSLGAQNTMQIGNEDYAYSDRNTALFYLQKRKIREAILSVDQVKNFEIIQPKDV